MKFFLIIFFTIFTSNVFSDEIKINLQNMKRTAGMEGYCSFFFEGENNTTINFTGLAFDITFYDHDGYIMDKSNTKIKNLRPKKNASTKKSVLFDCSEVKKITFDSLYPTTSIDGSYIGNNSNLMSKIFNLISVSSSVNEVDFNIN